VNGNALQTALARGWQGLRRRLGWGGLAGALVLALAGVLLLVADSLRNTAAASQASLESQRRQLSGLKRQAPAPVSESPNTDNFADTFPLAVQSAADLRVIFECAEKAQITLPKGDYALKADNSSPFITYTVTFPVREPYARLKLMASAVLQALPHAALEEVRLARADSAGVDLDATLRFTLVYRRR
jgi:hypothetical protein